MRECLCTRLWSAHASCGVRRLGADLGECGGSVRGSALGASVCVSSRVRVHGLVPDPQARGEQCLGRSAGGIPGSPARDP